MMYQLCCGKTGWFRSVDKSVGVMTAASEVVGIAIFHIQTASMCEYCNSESQNMLLDFPLPFKAPGNTIFSNGQKEMAGPLDLGSP